MGEAGWRRVPGTGRGRFDPWSWGSLFPRLGTHQEHSVFCTEGLTLMAEPRTAPEEGVSLTDLFILELQALRCPVPRRGAAAHLAPAAPDHWPFGLAFPWGTHMALST